MILKTNTIIGHRGCRLWMPLDKNYWKGLKFSNSNHPKSFFKTESDYPKENSLEAFLKAIEMGVEMVEMDIRRTRDGELVIFHDAEIDEMRIRGNNWEDVRERVLATGGAIERLEDVLKKLEGKIKLDIELKESGYEEEVIGMVLKYFEPANFIVKSFIDSTVKKIKLRFPTVTAGLLLGVSTKDSISKLSGIKLFILRITEFFPWQRVKNCQADFIAPSWRLCILGLHKSAQQRGIPVLVWTLNTPKLIRKFMESYAVNGIITDRPDLAKEIRDNL